jgi:hypothetical protein
MEVLLTSGILFQGMEAIFAPCILGRRVSLGILRREVPKRLDLHLLQGREYALLATAAKLFASSLFQPEESFAESFELGGHWGRELRF